MSKPADNLNVGSAAPRAEDAPADDVLPSGTPGAHADPRDARWQFSLRALLMLSVLCSMVLMVVSPVLRSWNWEHALEATLHVTIIAVPTVLAIARNYVRERATRRVAGRFITTLYRPGSFDRAMMLWLATFGVALLALVLVFTRETDLISAVLLALAAVLVIPPTFLNAFTRIVPGQVEICERGLIESGREFIASGRLSDWTVEGRIITLLLDAPEAEISESGRAGSSWQCQIETTVASRDVVLRALQSWCPGPVQEPPGETTEGQGDPAETS